MANKYMDMSELQDKLRDLRRYGVEVPTLNYSSTIPNDYGTRELRTGEVMDNHGNVVDLGKLERELVRKMTRPLKDLNHRSD